MNYPSLKHNALIDVLRLIRTQNIGPVTFFQLMQRFGNASAAIEALPEMSMRGGRKQALVAYSKQEAEKEIAAVEKFGAQFIMVGEENYPHLLQHIPDAPPVICVMGNTHLWNQKPLVGMVGSRNSSANGCQLAQKLARELGAAGVTVVSGLARGIDTFVHKGALATGTVGVIAGGIDNIYPSENAELYKQMREQGAIISEQPFGAIPFAGAFPGRNRIIAGMSLGTLVVEASPKSGSLITARLALENNRDLFAIPGSPLDSRAKGCNQLIKNGAHLVESVSDILQVIGNSQLRHLGETSPENYEMAQPVSLNETELEAARLKILDKLGITAVGVDELIEQCQTSAHIVCAVLLEYELAGRLKRSVGNKVSLTFDNEQEVA